MTRDESRDVWVYGDGNDGQSALAAIEHSRHLELEKNFPNVAQKCERYVPHDQLEAVERERDAERDSKREATRAWFNCKTELAAAQKRIAELEQEVRRVHHLIAIDRTGLAAGLDKVRTIVDGFAWLANEFEWGSYQYGDHSIGTLRAEIGACFDQVGEIIEATLKASGDRADSAAQNMGETYHPRCKDGCLNWSASFCACTFGRVYVPSDGSGFCSNHTRLTK